MVWQATSHRVVPTDWKTRKALVLKRHAGICHVCGHGQAEQVDHLLNLARGGNHEPANLAPIHGTHCPTCGRRCHIEKTAKESAAGRVSRRRTTEPHPGLL